MHKLRVGIFGGSGYSGVELLRLLARHPHAQIVFAASDRWRGDRVSDRVDAPASALSFVPVEGAPVGDCDVVALATPVEASLELAPPAIKRGVRVLDLSGAFRFKDAATFERAYGSPHPHPALLAEAAYGLPEWNGEALRHAGLVANPGCYPTCAVLPLLPLLRDGIVEPDGIIVNAASGTTGAGRTGKEALSFSEVHDDFRAYRVGKHQHAPEIQTVLAAVHARVRTTFTAHLLPISRGILSTVYARLAPQRVAQDVAGALSAFADQHPLLRYRPSPDEVALKDVVYSPRCHFSAAVDTETDSGRVVITSALDNLLKGAASQAVQNLNGMFGLPPTAGLL